MKRKNPHIFTSKWLVSKLQCIGIGWYKSRRLGYWCHVNYVTRDNCFSRPNTHCQKIGFLDCFFRHFDTVQKSPRHRPRHRHNQRINTTSSKTSTPKHVNTFINATSSTPHQHNQRRNIKYVFKKEAISYSSQNQRRNDGFMPEKSAASREESREQ